MRVLVLGGYGLIGSEICRMLHAARHEVTGLGRSTIKAKKMMPKIVWLDADITKFGRPERWERALRDIDVVINASGALQSGLRDNVRSVQNDAICCLIEACERFGIKKFIQISAPGVSETANTEFYRSKATADATLKSSKLAWTIFRPGLVIAPQAYGGTALVRMLAACPLVQPIVLADRWVQTVSVEHVALAVRDAVAGDFDRLDCDLVEPEGQTLLDLVKNVRQWLGFSDPRSIIAIPNWLGRLAALLADIAGWLGWRSALRTSSLSVLQEGVRGNPDSWRQASGQEMPPLVQTLASIPSTAQERMFARASLVFPFALSVLSLFWWVSGVIGLFKLDTAIQVLAPQVTIGLAYTLVIGGAVADMAIGLALIVRPWTRWACIASILVAATYLAGSLTFAPHLWLDPLGPMIKVFPAIALAAVVMAIFPER